MFLLYYVVRMFGLVSRFYKSMLINYRENWKSLERDLNFVVISPSSEGRVGILDRLPRNDCRLWPRFGLGI